MASLPRGRIRNPRNLPPPMDASEMAAVLAEAHAADQRAIAEVEAAAPMALEPCQHHDFVPRLVSPSSPWDDHRTQYGWCPSCSQWLMIVDYFNGRCDVRALTLPELDKFTSYEDRVRASEWLADHAEGHRA